MNKSRHVTFRCTPEQYAAIKKAAEHHDITVSKMLIHLIQTGVNTILTNQPLSQEQLNQAIEK